MDEGGEDAATFRWVCEGTTDRQSRRKQGFSSGSSSSSGGEGKKPRDSEAEI